MPGFINSIWKAKSTLLSSLLTLTSMSMVHYVGFVAQLPRDLITIAGTTLIIDVTTPFVFHVLFSYGISHIIVGLLYFFYPVYLIIDDRVKAGGRKLTLTEGRKFIRSQRQSMDIEPIARKLMHLVFGIPLFLIFYIQFQISFNTTFILTSLTIAMLLGIFIRAGFFNRSNIFHSIKLLKYRERTRNKLLLLSIGATLSALIIVSFLVGYERLTLLKNSRDRQVTNKYYSGYAKHLSSSQDMLLMLEKSTSGEKRYILSTPRFAMGFEDTESTFPHLKYTSD